MAVVCKHYDIYGGPEGLHGSSAPGGRFRVKVNISERVWRETHLPPFEACVKNGALGIMCSYSAVAFEGSGQQPVPSCANTALVRDELRGELGFAQHVVGDCGALSNEYRSNDQGWAASAEDAAAKSMAATTDLECEGADGPTSVYGNATLSNALRDKQISIEQINAALIRIYNSRMALGLLDVPQGTNPFDKLDGVRIIQTLFTR